MPFSNHYGLLLLPSFVALAVAKYCDEYVCLCVCLSARISPGPHSRSLPKFMCMLPVSVARSSSGMLTIGRIACRREGGDGSAQRGQSVIYNCLVFLLYHRVDRWTKWSPFFWPLPLLFSRHCLWAMVIRGKIIRTVLCCVVYDSCAQWYAHTHTRTHTQT